MWRAGRAVTCKVCTDPVAARGYCQTHYARWRRHGDPSICHPNKVPVGARRLSSSGYIRVKSPGHPLCPPSSAWVYEQRIVLYDSIGPGPHPCAWCGKAIDWGAGLDVDHIDGDKENNLLENLAPACRSCNTSRAIRSESKTRIVLTRQDLDDLLAGITGESDLRHKLTRARARLEPPRPIYPPTRKEQP